jgi:hypothetical protein
MTYSVEANTIKGANTFFNSVDSNAMPQNPMERLLAANA